MTRKALLTAPVVALGANIWVHMRSKTGLHVAQSMPRLRELSMLPSTPKDAAEVTVGGLEEHESCGSKESWLIGPHASGGPCTATREAEEGGCEVEDDSGRACGAALTLKASNEEIMRGAEMGYMMRW